MLSTIRFEIFLCDIINIVIPVFFNFFNIPTSKFSSIEDNVSSINNICGSLYNILANAIFFISPPERFFLSSIELFSLNNFSSPQSWTIPENFLSSNLLFKTIFSMKVPAYTLQF